MNVKNIWICPLLFHLRFDFKKCDFDARATLPKLGSDPLAPRVYNGGFKEKRMEPVSLFGEAAAKLPRQKCYEPSIVHSRGQ